MTSDLSASADHPARADQCAVEEAKASSNLQHAEGIVAGPRLVEAGWNDQSAAFHDALSILVHAVPEAAAYKNVPIKPQFYSEVARDALRPFSVSEIATLASGEPDAVAKARFALSSALDTLAATMLAHIVAHLRGIDNPEPWIIAPIVEEHLAATAREGTIMVWPDLLDAALKYNCPVAAHE